MSLIKIYFRIRNFLIYRISKSRLIWVISANRFTSNSAETPLTIVTGADSTHFKSLLNLLNSITKFEPEVNVSIWDLGFNDQEISELKDKFKRFTINKFDFEKYPNHLNIKINAGEYAWKPVIIYEEFNRNSNLLLWLDAGNVVKRRLIWIRKFIQVNGFFSPYSAGAVNDWTHPAMLERLKIKPPLTFKPNLNGAIVGFDPNSKNARELITAWYECALEKECIAPAGSSRINHRQDQAALTCLAYSFGLAPNGIFAVNRPITGIRQHQDVD